MTLSSRVPNCPSVRTVREAFTKATLLSLPLQGVGEAELFKQTMRCLLDEERLDRTAWHQLLQPRTVLSQTLVQEFHSTR